MRDLFEFKRTKLKLISEMAIFTKSFKVKTKAIYVYATHMTTAEIP